MGVSKLTCLKKNDDADGIDGESGNFSNAALFVFYRNVNMRQRGSEFIISTIIALYMVGCIC